MPDELPDQWMCSFCGKLFPMKSTAESHEIREHMKGRVMASRMKGKGVIRCGHCGSPSHSTRNCWKK